MKEQTHFEIIDIARQRFRFDKKHYRWQFVLKEGSWIELNKSIVEVYRILNEDGDEELSRTFPAVMMVGDVCSETALLMPVEVMPLIKKCPNCGYFERAFGYE